MRSNRGERTMDRDGLFRVASASIPVAVANPAANVPRILDTLRLAEEDQCELVVFPELSLTGYTCGDLFGHESLLDAAVRALVQLAEEAAELFRGVYIVGLPLRVRGALYNVAAALQQGELLAAIPKRHLPNYKEFYEARWFQPGRADQAEEISIDGLGEALLAPRALLLAADDRGGPLAEGPVIGIEICEDLWVPIPPSSHLALAGANVLVNLSASNELATKADYRRDLVVGQSARLMSAYLYASSAVTESTTDLVFGGHGLIAENGSLLAESGRFQREPEFIVADVDVPRLIGDRARTNSFHQADGELASLPTYPVFFTTRDRSTDEPPRRPIPPHPFVPAVGSRLDERCEEIFHIQVAGLAKRVERVAPKSLNIGVSGGLDSTLALLVAAKTCDRLGLDRSMIHGLTMPGFGTSEQTRDNAVALMNHLAVTAESIDIRTLCYDTFKSLGHRPFGLEIESMSLDDFQRALAELPAERRKDLVFENVQARLRTLLLMSRGFVVGTGDMSELALGWATYNGDHMSMYNPNVSIPKTLVRFLVRWVADHEFGGPARAVLHSIADTEISPELLPIGADGQIQSTEASIGPYELHDFFLYHTLRFGSRPGKIFRLARHARFDRPYQPAEIKRWLRVFFERFFTHQFKRSCLPDGPKVGTVSLSPRGDWRMPSDADPSAWLAEIDAIEAD